MLHKVTAAGVPGCGPSGTTAEHRHLHENAPHDNIGSLGRHGHFTHPDVPASTRGRPANDENENGHVKLFYTARRNPDRDGEPVEPVPLLIYIIPLIGRYYWLAWTSEIGCPSPAKCAKPATSVIRDSKGLRGGVRNPDRDHGRRCPGACGGRPRSPARVSQLRRTSAADLPVPSTEGCPCHGRMACSPPISR